MSQISIDLRDRVVTVDNLSYQIPLTAEMMQALVSAPIAAIQFSEGRAEIEYGRPMNKVVRRDEAQAAIKPFMDAWATENEKALEALRQAEAAKQAAGEQPEGTDKF